MMLFENNESKYVSINGKSFYLIRGYAKSSSELIFLQVVGNFPLFEEDLPDTKKWKLVKTKCRDTVIYTAYDNDFHNYQSERAKGKLLFPAPTKKGSYFLLLKFANEKYGFKLPDEKLAQMPEQTYCGLIEEEHDRGNSGIAAYMLDLYDRTEEDLKNLLFPQKE
jgi:hypothetical protein